MYLESEKVLLQKNYRGYHNTDTNTVYVSNKQPIDQISLYQGRRENGLSCWIVSFPLKYSKHNYTCCFESKKEASNYLNNIVYTYI
jgi:hypothetical protein